MRMRVLTATWIAWTASAAVAGAAPIALTLLGATEIATGTRFEGIEFGGISGLEMAADGSFYALSDDRGGAGRPPRFYRLGLHYDLDGFHDVTILSQTLLSDADGAPFPSDAPTVDPEALRLAPNGNLYISSEGNFSPDAGQLKQPFVREYTTDGAYVRDLAFPAGYAYLDGTTAGARDNLLFESLAVDEAGRVFVGNEGPLIADGPPSTAREGSFVRIAEIDPVTNAPVAQYAYRLPPVPLGGSGGAPGLTDIVAFGDGFLALERSYARGVGNTVSITYAEVLPETTDILGLAALDGASVVPMSREVLLTITDPFEGVDNDNLEALALGRMLANGHRSLVLAADNNFNAPFQTNLFMVFEIVPVDG